jgi:hypothetical protein
MFERISTGWELASQSFRVLRLDKELLLFPLLSGLACLLVLGSFALPLWNSEMVNGILNEQQAPESPLAYVVLFAFYFVNYFVIVYFNTALIACAIVRFRGGDPTLGDGIRAASARLPQIAGWALVSATVGLILRIIESSSKRAGEFAAALLGMAWTAVTYFVLPVLVVEKVGPFEAMKRSLSILRKTWGEALAANFGLGLIIFLISLLAAVPLIGGVVAFGTGNVVLGGIGIFVGVVLLILVALVSSAVDAILLGALYLYAAEGTVPEYFDKSLFQHAFAQRGR